MLLISYRQDPARVFGPASQTGGLVPGVRRPHIEMMDDPTIRLYPEAGKPGVWKWEILLKEKIVVSGMYAGSSEHAYATAHEALLRYQWETGKMRT